MHVAVSQSMFVLRSFVFLSKKGIIFFLIDFLDVHMGISFLDVININLSDRQEV